MDDGRRRGGVPGWGAPSTGRCPWEPRFGIDSVRLRGERQEWAATPAQGCAPGNPDSM